MESAFALLYILVGSLAAAFYGKNSPTAIPRIKRMFPSLQPERYEQIDFLLVVVFGTAIGYIYGPQDQIRALVAGAGSTMAIKQLVRAK